MQAKTVDEWKISRLQELREDIRHAEVMAEQWAKTARDMKAIISSYYTKTPDMGYPITKNARHRVSGQ